VIECFEHASQPNITEQEALGLLHFAVVGGGPTVSIITGVSLLRKYQINILFFIQGYRIQCRAVSKFYLIYIYLFLNNLIITLHCYHLYE
jgi:hypothetical protein